MRHKIAKLRRTGEYLDNSMAWEINQNGSPNTYFAKVIVLNDHGMHAGPSAKIAREAGKYDSDIALYKFDGTGVNAKSIMGILTTQLIQGEEGLLRAKGEDAKTALEAIVPLFESGFGQL